MIKLVVFAAFTMVVIILVTACAIKEPPMDWGALADYLEQQEKSK